MVVTAESTCNNRDPLLGAYIVSLFGLYAAAINRVVIQVHVAFSWGIFSINSRGIAKISEDSLFAESET